MHYLITGATGLIGSTIVRKLSSPDHTITVLTRDKKKAYDKFSHTVDTISSLDELAENSHIDVIINLAGEPIADARWTDTRKRLLENSRIQFTENLLAKLQLRHIAVDTLIQGSAVGFYGDGKNTILTENSPPNHDYAHQLCHDWEQVALTAQHQGIRVCIVRTGLVIAPNGGFLKRMLLPFKLGLGGKLGDGQQFMPWIHIDDIARLFIFLSQSPQLTGVFNGTAPHPVTNAEFCQTLATLLNRPAFMTTPACLLKVLLGEMSILLLTGQNALPEKAQAAGFKFEYTDVKSALSNVIK